MATQAKEKREKAKILRWWGVLGESSRVLRWLVAIVLAVAGAAFSFTQLGFVSVPTLDGDSGYVVVLLQLVALGALLLGTLPGAALGMAIGAILLVHAKVMPLDHYELAFITPVSSIVMFGLCGLMLGVLFAFVLRNNPGRVKRVIYITIVCIVASILYNVGFVTCAIGSLFDRILVNIGPEADVSVVTQMALATVAQLGDMNVQTWLTALLMAILCCLGDFLARRVQARRGALGLRAVFGAWLGVVVALAFMAISAISFASATLDGLVDSRDAMQGEVDYIYDQLVVSNERISLLNSVMEQGELTVEKIDVDKIDELVSTLDDRSLISGYTKEQDGVVIVTIDDEIYAANDEHFKDGISLEDAFGPEVVSSIGESIETGELQRIVFNGVPLSEISMEAEELQKLDPFIAYLYARKVPDIRVDSTGENVGYS